MISDSDIDSSAPSPRAPISPRKSVRRIHQDLRCFVIGDQIDDLPACQSIISNTMEALVKYGEDANTISQSRK